MTAAGMNLLVTKGARVPEAGNPPFGRVLRDLLIDRNITTKMGHPDWVHFVESLVDVHYESLRKVVVGDRKPTPELMRKVADALGVDPVETFYEYALWDARRQFDPDEVGPEQALANLKRWSASARRR